MVKRSYGPAIGSHLGKYIYEFIKERGTKYVFDRVAQCDTEGYPLYQMASDEVMYDPGLIYKKVS